MHDMGRPAFQDGEDAAWDDLEQVYGPAADAGTLPLRVHAYLPLTTWCAGCGHWMPLLCGSMSTDLCTLRPEPQAITFWLHTTAFCELERS